MDKLLTMEDAAERLGRTKQRVSQLVKEERLKAERFPGRALRIRESVLNAYIESTKIPDSLPALDEVAA